jgi:hypothetical protein
MKLAFRIICFPLRLVIGLAGVTIIALALSISPDSEPLYRMAESLYNFVRGV